MKEKIYTIPVTEAFGTDCECPLCQLEQKLESDSIDYILGPSLMEPDGRAITNENGFCRKHFELLYNSQKNRLGLGLIIDTHLVEKITLFKKKFNNALTEIQKDAQMSVIKNISNKASRKTTATEKYIGELLESLTAIGGKCAICKRIDHTMDRYIDVVLYLWFKEPEFKELFNSRKGFCLKHLTALVEGVKKYLGVRESAVFIENLMNMQISNLERMQQEVNWFTKKFDYRYQDAPWGNSKDAVPRSIQKLKGYSDLK